MASEHADTGVRLSHEQRTPSRHRHAHHEASEQGSSRATADPAGLAALTKGGLNALTKSLAIEVAKKGVRVNAVRQVLLKTGDNPEGGLDETTIASFNAGVAGDRIAFLDEFSKGFFSAGGELERRHS